MNRRQPSKSPPVSIKHPRLLVVIDTEEEFDWSSAFNRESTSVLAMRSVEMVQKIFDEYGIVPVYVIDYAVARQREGYMPLLEILRSGGCEIGAHLHPWVNPPFSETVNRFFSFPGNLPKEIERKKLLNLVDVIGENLGSKPTVYKAGRYGLGPNTAAILEDLGFQVDLSGCPYMNYADEGGPDFRTWRSWPFFLETPQKKILEIPSTVGYTGLLRKHGFTIHEYASQPYWQRWHAIGILARLNMVNKIRLNPEGYPAAEMVALTRALYEDGLRVFCLAFHSPSLEPGNTPYVTTQRELDNFLSQLRRFFDFFMGELNGCATIPLEVRANMLGIPGEIGTMMLTQ